jgi:hypothetical protein
MDWCSVYLSPQALPKYIYLSPPLIVPTTSTELGQKNARCESLRALLHYVEWDRIVTLTGAQADWGLRYRIYVVVTVIVIILVIAFVWPFDILWDRILSILNVLYPVIKVPIRSYILQILPTPFVTWYWIIF